MPRKIYNETLAFELFFSIFFCFDFLYLKVYDRKTRFSVFCIILDTCVCKMSCKGEKYLKRDVPFLINN